MRRLLTALCLLLLLPGALLAAEEAISPYKWTIGYESGSIILRRFVGRDWEVYFGGSLNRSRNNEYSTELQYFQDPDHSGTLHEFSDENFREYSNSNIKLGVGRTVMRTDRFWLNATMDFNFQATNSEYRTFDMGVHGDPDRTRITEATRHSRSFGCGLGLRPAFDVTDRITVAMGFGFNFRLTDTIRDDHFTTRYDSDGDGTIDQEDDNHVREAYRTEEIGSFGSIGIDYLAFIFRF